MAGSPLIFRGTILVRVQKGSEDIGKEKWKEMVPKEGVEPSCHCWRQILSLVRLPFRHFGRENGIT